MWRRQILLPKPRQANQTRITFLTQNKSSQKVYSAWISRTQDRTHRIPIKLSLTLLKVFHKFMPFVKSVSLNISTLLSIIVEFWWKQIYKFFNTSFKWNQFRFKVGKQLTCFNYIHPFEMFIIIVFTIKVYSNITARDSI